MARTVISRLISVKTLIRIGFVVLGLSSMAHAQWANAATDQRSAGAPNFMEGGGG